MPLPVVREYSIVEIGREFRIVRKRVKTMTLRLKKAGPQVTAPVYVSDDRIRKFIVKYSDWIENRLSNIGSSKDRVFLFGVAYKREDVQSAVVFVEFSDGVCRVGGRTEEDREKALLKRYREEIAARIPPLFEKWQRETGLYPKKILITSATSYLGRCELPAKNIRISCRLAAKPEEVLEYVVLHELCHLKIRGHQKNFYALVSKYMPDYKRRIKAMRGCL